MLRSRTSRFVVVVAASLSLLACDEPYDCGTRTQTTASGTVRDAAGTAVGTARVELRENVGPSFFQMAVGVGGLAGATGAPLKGHVTRARLVDEFDNVIAEIPINSGRQSLNVVALDRNPMQQEYTQVRAVITTRRARIILETDLPGNARIETILSEFVEMPGVTGRCVPG